MKKVPATMDYCDCWCINCNYSFHNCSCNPTCPYCEDEMSNYILEPREGEHIVECEECWKKFAIILSINYI